METWKKHKDGCPAAPGWYPTLTKWRSANGYVPAAHQWLGERWRSKAPERIELYFDRSYATAEEARLVSFADDRQAA